MSQLSPASIHLGTIGTMVLLSFSSSRLTIAEGFDCRSALRADSDDPRDQLGERRDFDFPMVDQWTGQSKRPSRFTPIQDSRIAFAAAKSLSAASASSMRPIRQHPSRGWPLSESHSSRHNEQSVTHNLARLIPSRSSMMSWNDVSSYTFAVPTGIFSPFAFIGIRGRQSE